VSQEYPPTVLRGVKCYDPSEMGHQRRSRSGLSGARGKRRATSEARLMVN